MISFKVKNNFPIYLLIALGAMVFGVKYFGLIINITPSMPIGLYVKKDSDTIKRQDVVAICLAEPYKSLGLRLNYLIRGKACENSAPLIKQIIAVPKDDVRLADDYIAVNHHIYAYKTQYVDSLNRKLDVYPRGIYLNTSYYWVIGTNDDKSWDSRYWGPIKEQQILSILKPILTF